MTADDPVRRWPAEPAPEHPSDFALAKYRARETSSTEAQEMRIHLGNCPPCQLRAQRLDQEAQELLANQPEELFVAQVMARHQRAPRRGVPSGGSTKTARRQGPLHWLIPGLAAAGAVAALFLFTVPPPDKPPGPDSSSAFRLKGTRVDWVVERDGQQQLAGDDFKFQPRDRIALRVTSSREGRPAVIALNGDGDAELIWPTEDQDRFALVAGQSTPLPFSLEVEPGSSERLLLFVSGPGTSTAELLQATADARRTIPLPPGSRFPLELVRVSHPDFVSSRMISLR